MCKKLTQQGWHITSMAVADNTQLTAVATTMSPNYLLRFGRHATEIDKL